MTPPPTTPVNDATKDATSRMMWFGDTIKIQPCFRLHVTITSRQTTWHLKQTLNTLLASLPTASFELSSSSNHSSGPLQGVVQCHAQEDMDAARMLLNTYDGSDVKLISIQSQEEFDKPLSSHASSNSSASNQFTLPATASTLWLLDLPLKWFDMSVSAPSTPSSTSVCQVSSLLTAALSHYGPTRHIVAFAAIASPLKHSRFIKAPRGSFSPASSCHGLDLSALSFDVVVHYLSHASCAAALEAFGTGQVLKKNNVMRPIPLVVCVDPLDFFSEKNTRKRRFQADALKEAAVVAAKTLAVQTIAQQATFTTTWTTLTNLAHLSTDLVLGATTTIDKSTTQDPEAQALTTSTLALQRVVEALKDPCCCPLVYTTPASLHLLTSHATDLSTAVTQVQRATEALVTARVSPILKAAHTRLSALTEQLETLRTSRWQSHVAIQAEITSATSSVTLLSQLLTSLSTNIITTTTAVASSALTLEALATLASRLDDELEEVEVEVTAVRTRGPHVASLMACEDAVEAYTTQEFPMGSREDTQDTLDSPSLVSQVHAAGCQTLKRFTVSYVPQLVIASTQDLAHGNTRFATLLKEVNASLSTANVLEALSRRVRTITATTLQVPRVFIHSLKQVMTTLASVTEQCITQQPHVTETQVQTLDHSIEDLETTLTHLTSSMEVEEEEVAEEEEEEAEEEADVPPTPKPMASTSCTRTRSPEASHAIKRFKRHTPSSLTSDTSHKTQASLSKTLTPLPASPVSPCASSSSCHAKEEEHQENTSQCLTHLKAFHTHATQARQAYESWRATQTTRMPLEYSSQGTLSFVTDRSLVLASRVDIYVAVCDDEGLGLLSDSSKNMSVVGKDIGEKATTTTTTTMAEAVGKDKAVVHPSTLDTTEATLRGVLLENQYRLNALAAMQKCVASTQ